MVEKNTLDEKIELDSQVRHLWQNLGMSLNCSEFALHDDHTLGRINRSDKFGDGIHLFAKRPQGDYVHLMCYLDQSLLATEPNQLFLTAYYRPEINWGKPYTYAMPQGWYQGDFETLNPLINQLIN